ARRFLFIHIYKTGGTTVRAALQPHAHLPNWSWWQALGLRLPLCPTPPSPVLEPHAWASEVRAALDRDLYNAYFKFAFVRNPWDWQVSLYHHALQTSGHHYHARISAMESFEEFLLWHGRHSPWLQKDFICDESGELIVDFVGRFETLAADFAAICSRIGVRAKLQHLNKSQHGDYRAYYTPRAQRMVEEFWQEDLDFFGYSFDEDRDGCLAA